jgi:hypothetical protein
MRRRSRGPDCRPHRCDGQVHRAGLQRHALARIESQRSVGKPGPDARRRRHRVSADVGLAGTAEEAARQRAAARSGGTGLARDGRSHPHPTQRRIERGCRRRDPAPARARGRLCEDRDGQSRCLYGGDRRSGRRRHPDPRSPPGRRGPRGRVTGRLPVRRASGSGIAGVDVLLLPRGGITPTGLRATGHQGAALQNSLPRTHRRVADAEAAGQSRRLLRPCRRHPDSARGRHLQRGQGRRRGRTARRTRHVAGADVGSAAQYGTRWRGRI